MNILLEKPSIAVFAIVVFIVYIHLCRKGKIAQKPDRQSCARVVMDAGALYTALVLVLYTQVFNYTYHEVVLGDNGIGEGALTAALVIALFEAAFGLMAVFELWDKAEVRDNDRNP